MVQEPEVRQKAAQIARIMSAEPFAVTNRQLESRAFHVADQDLQIVGIDVGMFWRALEKVFRMLDDVLVKRRAGRYQHCQGSRLPPSGGPGGSPGGWSG